MKVSYDRMTRDKAKAENKGLITIEIITKRGFRTTTQLVAEARVITYANRALKHLLKLVDA